MVTNKKYKHALEKWNEWEKMATSLALDNGRLLKEMKEINDLSLRVNEHNIELLAECRRLREQLAVVTAERDRYFDLLPDVSYFDLLPDGSCECSNCGEKMKGVK